jgi:hypothetical protein
MNSVIIQGSYQLVGGFTVHDYGALRCSCEGLRGDSIRGVATAVCGTLRVGSGIGWRLIHLAI